MTQIVKVANMFAVTVHDLTLPVSLHVSAVRVLFTITERLHQTDVSPPHTNLLSLHVYVYVYVYVNVNVNVYKQIKYDDKCLNMLRSCLQFVHKSLNRCTYLHLPNM